MKKKLKINENKKIKKEKVFKTFLKILKSKN